MNIPIPSKAHSVLARLNEAGFSAYAVGGCVRDSLLGKCPQDWDICTAATPGEIIDCFDICPTILTGVKYGTVTVIWEDEPFEITTFRGEAGYSDSRHPDEVCFLSSLDEDLSRRDFTVNAMAADKDGVVTDRFGGLEDLRKGIIRCVGDPKRRFSEDALRILRALRFAAKLGFAIKAETANAIHALKDTLKAVAAERLKKELSGLLCGKNAAELLDEFSDVLCVLIPELAPCMGFCQYNPHHCFDVWQHTLTALKHSEPEPVLRLAVLLHDIGKPAVFTMDKNLVGHFYGHCVVSAALCEKILRRLRYDNETVRRVSTLVREHDFPLLEQEEKRIRRLLGKLGETDARLLLRLRRADRMGKGTESALTVNTDVARWERILEEILEAELCFSLKQLALNGTDLLAMGIPKGRRIGLILNALLRAVVEEGLPNEKEALVKYAQKLAHNLEIH